jgi:hypothetical protein
MLYTGFRTEPKETEKYNRMKARAAEKKKEHIKTLGV